MSRWRTVVIENRSKLDLKINNICVRGNDNVKFVNLSEIDTLILESTSISITSALLCELVKQKVKVIFCDEKHLPLFEVTPYYDSYDSVTRIQKQFLWSNETREKLWTEIVKEKIKNQMNILKKYDKSEYKLLEKYIQEVEHNDSTNREGHAAKVYFNALFGKDFTRNSESSINIGLNYGYQILLSQFSKEIVQNGYLTQIGIHHKNQFNKFNLCSDLMEPFRPVVDEICYLANFEKFDKDEKHKVLEMFKKKIKIDNGNFYLVDAIKIYVKSVFKVLDENKLEFLKVCDEF
ncbi:type II CRISPR-associated endonuclease Cas1 [Oceanivirga miroungae]|uniref:CRISPR-associated endonuclease Cas1 n=1 Tax=Oceanivirga miroungae TaxID=1130046 RepID=A0A6I8M8T9_9FUSO|nr:type II CRISPR-associated endonuclease Cas1 [Oceanivirga miroungae]VWL85949.1 CRISPR-associated protein Cas1 [Oceanivirga miroungae]